MYNQIIDYILNSPESTKRGEIKYLIKKAFKDNNELSDAYDDILNNEGRK